MNTTRHALNCARTACARRLFIVLVLILGSPPIHAWEIVDLRVSKEGGSFTTEAQFLVDVPHQAVVEAFTAFDRLADLNPAVVESSARMMPGGAMRVSTRLRDCIGLFCRSFNLVEDVRLGDNGTISAKIVKDGSDFDHGYSSWRISSVGTQTRVEYHSVMKPGFWTPPLLGLRAIRKSLHRQIRQTAENLEK